MLTTSALVLALLRDGDMVVERSGIILGPVQVVCKEKQRSLMIAGKTMPLDSMQIVALIRGGRIIATFTL